MNADSLSPVDAAGVFAAVFAVLYPAHLVGDHWLQTSRQATLKGAPGWPGRLACAAHVATYTGCALLALAGLCAATGLHLNVWRVVAGVGISALTHYLADRRTPLRRLAQLTGRGGLYTLGTPRPGRDDNPTLGTGAYALDQSWHVGWLAVAALVIA